MSGLDILYTGDFNSMHVIDHQDGTHTITLSKDGAKKIYQFTVRDLYGPNEKVLSEETIPTVTPDHITKRVLQAKKNVEKGVDQWK